MDMDRTGQFEEKNSAQKKFSPKQISFTYLKKKNSFPNEKVSYACLKKPVFQTKKYSYDFFAKCFISDVFWIRLCYFMLAKLNRVFNKPMRRLLWAGIFI